MLALQRETGQKIDRRWQVVCLVSAIKLPEGKGEKIYKVTNPSDNFDDPTPRFGFL